MKKKIVIAGKNNIAVEILNYIVDFYGDKVEAAVVCNRTETGRGTWQKSLRLEAKNRGIPEYRLEELYEEKDLAFLSLEYDKIIKPEKFVSKELYNIHFSLLPQYRGMYTSALPILNGESYSGVTLHRIDWGIDTGDIIDQVKIPIDREETCQSLYEKYINAGIAMVKKNLRMLLFHPYEIQTVPQDPLHASYYGKHAISYANLQIDLNQTACSIHRQIRAYSFREYQMPRIYGKAVIASELTGQRSTQKPGTVLFQSETGFMIATIDYDLIVYYDRFDELMKACADGNLQMVKEICVVKQHIKEMDKEGRTPVLAATAHGHMEIAQYFIGIGAKAGTGDGCQDEK